MRERNANAKRIYRSKLQSASNLKSAISIASLIFVLGFGGCASVEKLTPPKWSFAKAEVHLTTPDKLNLLSNQGRIDASGSANSQNIIVIKREQELQTFVGVGAAITDASAHLFQNALDEGARQKIIHELFAPDEMAFSFTRLTIGASDFSKTHYSLNDVPKGQIDRDLSNFSLNSMPNEVLPIIKMAKSENKNLKIMATPWSAPGFMKTTDSLIGGSLKPEFYSSFAKYLAKYAQEMAQNGIKIDYISVQNEPHFTPTDYPGMRFDDKERATFLKDHIGPEMAKLRVSPKILEWDHNWNEVDAPINVLEDKDAAKFVNGVAWHCYGGDVNAQSIVRDKFPDKDVYFTECSGGEWGKDWNSSFGWQVENLIIRTSRNWAKGILLWNMALDENFGPHLGGCGDCRGVITINSKNGEIARNMEYYALGHISKFVKIGARRVQSSEQLNGLHNVAFKNPDGTLVDIIVNRSDNLQKFSIQDGAKYYNYELPKGAAATIVIK